METNSTRKNRAITALRRDIIITRLATGESVANVARELGLNATHVHDWLRSDLGVARLESSLDESRRILEARLPILITKSLDILESALDSPFMSSGKLTAVKLTLQAVTRLSKSKQPCSECEARVVDSQ